MKKILIFITTTYYRLLYVLSFFIQTNSKKISFINTHHSDSSLILVCKKLKKQNPKTLVYLITEDPRKSTILQQIKFHFKLLDSKIIITTHSPILKTSKNITLELWHGMPLKSMNLMDKSVKTALSFSRIDYLNSCSPFFNTIMNSCFGIRGNQYVIFGSPRNDLLFNSKNKKKIQKLLQIKNHQKFGIYMPTFRDKVEDKNKYEQFIFNLGFNKFNITQLNQYLVKKNTKLILKPHPHDNDLWTKLFEKLDLSNIFLLTEEYLIKNNLDFYEILGNSDLLITDYSSVYIDYLLTDKPIIFIPTDIDQYRKDRSLLLEPYDFWTPGPKVYTQKNLEDEITKCLKDKEYYQKERHTLKNIFHKYQDNKSTERVVNFINYLLKEK